MPLFSQWTYDPFVADYNLGGGGTVSVMARASQEEMEME